MEKSLIAQIAEIQKQYDHPFHMTNYKAKDGKTIFMLDMGKYSFAGEEPDVVLKRMIYVINEREKLIMTNRNNDITEQKTTRIFIK